MNETEEKWLKMTLIGCNRNPDFCKFDFLPWSGVVAIFQTVSGVTQISNLQLASVFQLQICLFSTNLKWKNPAILTNWKNCLKNWLWFSKVDNPLLRGERGGAGRLPGVRGRVFPRLAMVVRSQPIQRDRVNQIYFFRPTHFTYSDPSQIKQSLWKINFLGFKNWSKLDFEFLTLQESMSPVIWHQYIVWKRFLTVPMSMNQKWHKSIIRCVKNCKI